MRLSATRILIAGQWHTDKMLVIEKGVIAGIEPMSQHVTEHLTGDLVPGFIDVQVNGGGGLLFNAEPCLKTLKIMQQAHARYGTTAMLPTLITDEYTVMSAAADAVAEAMTSKLSGIVGIHFEGPFISKARKGVHKSEFIRIPDDKELAVLTRRDLGKVVITVAPEHFPLDILQELTEQGVIVCLGHSAATYEQTQAAIEAGAKGFTHLFNAMSPLTSREPGMVGAAFLQQDTYAGLVLDHFHVHSASSQIALKNKGVDRIMLVTDAMAHVGTDTQKLPFFDTEIKRENNRLTTPDGTLAGSCLDMTTAVRNASRSLGVTLSEAVQMASATPAEFIGLAEQMGKIQRGYRANMVLLNDDCQVQQVYIDGESVNSQ
ncbi:MAG: N-acetylglucosamine-6-phosphate deacetylase [Aestuariibacter sp.]